MAKFDIYKVDKNFYLSENTQEEAISLAKMLLDTLKQESEEM